MIGLHIRPQVDVPQRHENSQRNQDGSSEEDQVLPPVSHRGTDSQIFGDAGSQVIFDLHNAGGDRI